MSDECGEWSYTSSLEFIADELYANPSHDAVDVTTLLPSDQLEPGLANRVREGAKRYWRGKLKHIEHDTSAARWRACNIMRQVYSSPLV